LKVASFLTGSSKSVQLAKENKTFVYKDVIKGGRTRNLANPLRYLTNAELCFERRGEIPFLCRK